MTLRYLICAVSAAVWAFTAVPAAAAGSRCELERPVVFAGLDWDSNRFHTALARRILETGYGCTTDMIPGSTLPMLMGLSHGDIDVMMEVWLDNVTEPWKKAAAAGQGALDGTVRDAATVDRDTALEDVLVEALAARWPVAVVDGRGVLLGAVPKSILMAAMTGQ